MTRRIEVVPYDPEWSELFKEEVAKLIGIFGAQIVSIHHIGSTAIPGILAKPIIDVLVEVQEIKAIDDFNQSMIERGCVPKGEFGICGSFFSSREPRRIGLTTSTSLRQAIQSSNVIWSSETT